MPPEPPLPKGWSSTNTGGFFTTAARIREWASSPQAANFPDADPPGRRTNSVPIRRLEASQSPLLHLQRGLSLLLQKRLRLRSHLFGLFRLTQPRINAAQLVMRVRMAGRDGQ